MRVYLAVCCALVTIVVTQTQSGHAGRSGPSGVRGNPGIVGAPGPIGDKGTPQMKYCPVSSSITNFLRQFRFTGLNGATGRKGRTKRQTSASSWIIQPNICLHAGFNVQEHIFEMRTKHCCDKCRRTNFGKCMRKFSGPERCHSEAIRCIATCINTNGGQPGRLRPKGGCPVPPGAKGSPAPPGPTGGRPGRPGLPAPQKCPTTRKKVGNSYCLERSCIPV